ncbi:MAG: hypothetical protein MUC31_03000 [Bacteroidales bacterium]|jgi:hypothetical protein|nr:hypothetical protein [Bacteroidales bacterium]
MNRQQFFQWMDDPALLSSDSAADLQQLALDYPYFQTARMLYLMNLKILRDYRFEQELRQVAAFVADRARLRDWLVNLDEPEHSGSGPGHPEKFLHPLPGKMQLDNHLKSIEEQIKASLDEIELKKSRLRELIEEKMAITGDQDSDTEEQHDKKDEFAMRPLPKDDLLEEFIRQKQNQSQNRVTFFNPEESARRSIEENDGVLSETLARLVAAQGKKEKAIKIYQQLMMKNPQKSSYFAAQIEKLIKEQ